MIHINFTNLKGTIVEILYPFEIFEFDGPEQEIIDELYDTGEILPNCCSQNAQIIMQALNDFYGEDRVKYVEGYAMDEYGHKMAHCWNLIDGEFFDITADCFWEYNGAVLYRANRIFNTRQLSHFRKVGRGMTISFDGCPDNDFKNKIWFNDEGFIEQRKLSKKELRKNNAIETMIKTKIKNHLDKLSA